MAIEDSLGQSERDSAEERLQGKVKKLGAFIRPFLAAAFITRGAAYALDPRFYALEKKDNSLLKDVKVDNSGSEYDDQSQVDWMRGLGFIMVGTGAVMGAFDIKSSVQISRRSFLMKAAAAVAGFADAQFLNMSEQRLSPEEIQAKKSNQILGK